MSISNIYHAKTVDMKRGLIFPVDKISNQNLVKKWYSTLNEELEKMKKENQKLYKENPEKYKKLLPEKCRYF